MKLVLNSIVDRETRSQSMLKTFLDKEILHNVQFVSVFVSFTDEVDSRSFVDYCWQKSIVVCVPEYTRHHPSQPIVMREWVKEGDLEEIKPGLFHPKYGPLHQIEEIDLVLVPGLAFSERGLRLGRGGGFYDRLLAQVLGKSVGICFSEQLRETIPAEAHDISVSEVVSV